MHKIQKSIIIARTSRSGYSSMSEVSARAIQKVLSNYYQNVEVATLASSIELDTIVDKQPDLVIAGFIHLPDDEASDANQFVWLSDYLEAHDICHTGSESPAMKLSLHKQLAKDVIIKNGLKTADYIRIRTIADINANLSNLTFPLFVKPASLGGGEGIDDDSVVQNIESLFAQVTKLNIAGITDILVETYLSGMEYSVAILRKLNSKELLAMPIQIIAPLNDKGNRVLSLSVKSNDTERTTGIFDSAIQERLMHFATKVFTSLGARDYGRIDIRCDAQGEPYFLEANLIPSLIKDYGNFPKCCALNENMDYDSILLSIINLAFERIVTNSPEPIAPISI